MIYKINRVGFKEIKKIYNKINYFHYTFNIFYAGKLIKS